MKTETEEKKRFLNAISKKKYNDARHSRFLAVILENSCFTTIDLWFFFIHFSTNFHEA